MPKNPFGPHKFCARSPLPPGTPAGNTFPYGPAPRYNASFAVSPRSRFAMLLTDLNGPLSVQPLRPGMGRLLRPTRLVAFAILLVGFATLGATLSLAQDQPDPQNQQDRSVADAARQQRAHKQEIQKHSGHVYTDDDLKRAHILTPADLAAVEASKKRCAQENNCSPAPSQHSPASLDANSQPDGTSLGEVARRYRKQKELQALKPKPSEPFHLSIGTPALASPILPERPEIRLPVQPELRPRISSHVFRRDPFSSVLARPALRRPEIRHPEVRVPDISPVVRENVPPENRPEAVASVRGNVLPTPHAKAAHPKMSGDVRPHVSPKAQPAVRQRIPSVVRPATLPQVLKDVVPKHQEEIAPVAPRVVPRHVNNVVPPVVHARRRLIAPRQPRIASHTRAPSVLIPPMQPPPPSKSVQPVAPFLTVRPPSEPQPTLSSSVSRGQKTLTVERGDSLWSLARQNLGRGSRWPEFLAANRWMANPNVIRAGAQLSLPIGSSTSEATGGARTASAAAGTTVIRVHKGDTLWALAKSTLGRSSDWPCLESANPSIGDPNRIREGQRLLLPSVCNPKLAHRGSALLHSQRLPAP